MKKNFLFVSTMEEKGYDITFQNGKVCVCPKGSSFKTTKVIGVNRGKLYILYFEPTQAFIHNNNDLCEL